MSHALLQAWEKTLRRRGGDRAVVQAADGASVTFRELDARASAWLAARCPTAQLQGRAVVFAARTASAGWKSSSACSRPARSWCRSMPPSRRWRSGGSPSSLRAGCWWDGTQLEALPDARRYRDPAVCLIKLTSGTTGQPRALVFTAGQLLADGGR